MSTENTEANVADKLAQALRRIAGMCMAPPNFSDATIREIAISALAAHESYAKACEAEKAKGKSSELVGWVEADGALEWCDFSAATGRNLYVMHENKAPATVDNNMDAARYRYWRDNAEALSPVLRYESPSWIDAYLSDILAGQESAHGIKLEGGGNG